MRPIAPTIIRCDCGKVAVRLEGKPILSAICHCDDCQRASAELEALPPGRAILDAAGGTAYVMYRRDRVVVAEGAELLRDHAIENEPFTKRVIAGCCNAPLYLDFAKGHWLSFFRDRFQTQPLGARMRTNIKYAKNPDGIPLDLSRSANYPFGFIVRLIASKIAMDLSKKPGKGATEHENRTTRD